MSRWFQNANGSVSVYFIVILLPVFMFHAVLIDFARIKIAEREAELSVKAGVRSLLAGYDLKLQPYGLFGLDRNNSNLIPLFNEVMKQNLINTRLEPDSVSLHDYYSLANQVVFRQQIVQEMKYRAPIEFGLELIDKFKKTGITANLQATTHFSDLTEQLESLIEHRNDQLNTAWNHTLQFLQKAANANDKYDRRATQLQELAEQIGLNSLEDVKKSLTDIDDNINQVNQTLHELSQSLETTKKSIRDLSETVKKDVQKMEELKDLADQTASSISNIEFSLQELVSKKDELNQLITHIIEYTALIQLTKSGISSDLQALTGSLHTVLDSISKAQEFNDTLDQEKKKLTDVSSIQSAQVFNSLLIYDQDYFSQYKIGVSKVLALFSGMETKWQNTTLFTNGFYHQWSQEREALTDQINDFKQVQGNKEEERKRHFALINQKKEEQLSRIQNAMNEAKKAIGNCAVTTKDPDEQAYKKLEGDDKSNDIGLTAKYSQYNHQLDMTKKEAPLYDIELSEKSDLIGEKAVGWMKEFIPFLNGFRSELYVNEYALTKFNNRTNEVSNTSDHTLSNQEVEYILYGFSSCLNNYSAAYGEMLVFFTGIRTTEALMQPQTELLNLGSPLLVFLAAAAQGAVEAVKDMSALIQGKEVPIFKKIAQVTVNYKDLLRLFMLLHPNESARMSRMQALIELNTGESLVDKATYYQASASVSLQLWFAPVIKRTLQISGLSNCSFTQDMRCSISKTAVMSYE